MTASTQPSHGPEGEAPVETPFCGPATYFCNLGIDWTLVEEIVGAAQILTTQRLPDAA